MIDKKLIPVNGLKKEPFSGCHTGMRYFFKANEDKETFTATIYPEPWSFDKTPDEDKESNCFPLSEDGMNASIEWLYQMHKEKEEFWQNSTQNSMHIVSNGK